MKHAGVRALPRPAIYASPGQTRNDDIVARKCIVVPPYQSSRVEILRIYKPKALFSLLLDNVNLRRVTSAKLNVWYIIMIKESFPLIRKT